MRGTTTPKAIRNSKKILILGGSGFIGNALYRELSPYFNVHATYCTAHRLYENNRHFHQWDMETEPVSLLLDSLRPDIVIASLRGNFEAQLYAHQKIIDDVVRRKSNIIFLSSANVFDAFSNYPSYEYDKTLSLSVYGRFKIKIENALLRLPNPRYCVVRLPMVFGANSPRIEELTTLYRQNEAIEVFPNVIINATTVSKLTQQLHYIINRNKTGVFHLGSSDVVHHDDLLIEFCKQLQLSNPFIKRVYSSNKDRYLAVLPKENNMPDNLQVSIQEVIDSVKLGC